MEEAELEVETDAWGNLIGRRPGTDRAAPELWTGSHLDTVPEGGRFDGALGVVAGLEAVERVARPGRQGRTLAVVAFRDEEGATLPLGCLGSRGRFGLLDAAERHVAAELGLGSADPPPFPGAFVEAHIEQGPRLEQAGVPLGLVTSIAATARGLVTLSGAARHAGTTPMDARDDALCAAAELVLRIRDAALAVPGSVATVGRLEVEPGAANVVPGRVTLTVDARAPDRGRLDALLERLGLDLAVTQPVTLDAGLRAVLREEMERLGLDVVELASGAGHDAGILAAAGVPAAMLFVRSEGGVSHHPDEETTFADVAVCVDALAAALARLARKL